MNASGGKGNFPEMKRVYNQWAVLAGLRFILAMIVFFGHMSPALPHWFVLTQLNAYAGDVQVDVSASCEFQPLSSLKLFSRG